MKKLLCILLLLAVFVDTTEAKVQVGIGVKVGPAFGKWNNQFKGKLSSAGGTVNFIPGIHAGLQTRVWFNKFVGLNLGAEFNMVGNIHTRYSGAGNADVVKIIHKENQLTVPLTALVGWGNERLRIYAQLGGYFGYVINGTDRVEITQGGSVLPTSTEKSDYGDNGYNNIDVGIRGGAGLQVYVDKKLKSCVTFDLNYDYGFMEVFRNGTPTYYPNASQLKFTNSKLMIGVGYIYCFGKSQSEEKPNRLTDATAPAPVSAPAVKTMNQ